MAELCVTRVFDAMRMIVRAVTFTPKASSPLQRAQIKRSGRFPSRSKSAGAALVGATTRRCSSMWISNGATSICHRRQFCGG